MSVEMSSDSLSEIYKQRYGIRYRAREGHQSWKKGDATNERSISSDGSTIIKHHYDNGVVKVKSKTPEGKWILNQIVTPYGYIGQDGVHNAVSVYSGAKNMYDGMLSNLDRIEFKLSVDDMYHELDFESRASLTNERSSLRKTIQRLASLSPEERIRAILHLTKGEENEMKNLVKTHLQKEVELITRTFKFKL